LPGKSIAAPRGVRAATNVQFSCPGFGRRKGTDIIVAAAADWLKAEHHVARRCNVGFTGALGSY